jgi:hypothetical protein
VSQSSISNRRLISSGISREETEMKQRGSLGLQSERGPVPRSIISKRVKIPSVLFTRIS